MRVRLVRCGADWLLFFMLKTRINSFLGLMLVASYSFVMGLAIWQAATDTNPLAEILVARAVELDSVR